MAVVGVDIGDHSTYISVARLGGVETISNDYSLRSTPTIVGFGERQRFMGVSAENQRNLNPRNTVSYFKNTVGRSFNDIESLSARFGASVRKDENGRLLFKLQNRELGPEQTLGMMFTKVKELVKGVEGDIETLVVSVPIYFTQAQRLAVRDAALISGLHINQVISDTAALARCYGKTKDLTEDTRNVVFVDVGCEGTQAVVAEVSVNKAKILASSYNRVGGKLFDDYLVEFAVNLIEEKHKIKLKGDIKALNKIRNAMEKAKKTMSTNTNLIPVQIDSIMEDLDVSFTVDRAQFEELIKPLVSEIRSTLGNLLDSTTVKRDELYGVEIVGGSSRIPVLKQTIQDVFGVAPRTELNTDEAVSRGCALKAASISSKFITKKFDVEDTVHQAVEAVFVYSGEHEKALVCDEGDWMSEEKKIEISADLPLNIALQYADSADVEEKLISLYKVNGVESSSGVFSLTFSFNELGVLELREAVLTSQEKRRRISESGDGTESEQEMMPCRTVLSFTKSMPEPLRVGELEREEANMVLVDQEEILRQEEKNRLEEQLYKFRSHIMEDSEPVEKEEVFINLKNYLDEIETWLYEEGEDAPKISYSELLSTLENKMMVYTTWFNKYMQMMKREEEKKMFLEKQANQRQIPIVYEGQDEYVPKRGSPGRRGRGEQFPRDPFGGFGRSSFFDDSPFGW